MYSQGDISTLPLFLLHTVLFPQYPIQLHVFEERYRAMINGCIERGVPFGVSLIREGAEVGSPAVPHDVGCVARIVGIKRYEDGQMDIVAIGENRFRLLDYHEGDLPYLVGQVELLEDAPLPEAGTDEESDLQSLTDAVADTFLGYLGEVARSAGMDLPDLELPKDATGLAFCIGQVALMGLEDKQALLELTDARARIEMAAHILEAHKSQVKQVGEVAAAAGVDLEVVLAKPVDLNSPLWSTYRRLGAN